MDLTALLALGVEVIQIGVQVYAAVNKVLPEIESLYADWAELASAALNGKQVAEADIQAIRAKITALSAGNAALEEKIIDPAGAVAATEPAATTSAAS